MLQLNLVNVLIPSTRFCGLISSAFFSLPKRQSKNYLHISINRNKEHQIIILWFDSYFTSETYQITEKDYHQQSVYSFSSLRSFFGLLYLCMSFCLFHDRKKKENEQKKFGSNLFSHKICMKRWNKQCR